MKILRFKFVSVGEAARYYGVSVATMRRGSSITVTCKVRNKVTKKTICVADDIVSVRVGPDSRMPVLHGKTMEALEQFNLNSFNN